MKVAYLLPYLQKPGGWRTHSVALIAALRSLPVSIEPTLLVAQADLPAARMLFPDLPVLSVPVTQALTLQSRQGWRLLVTTWLRLQSLRLSAIDLVHSLEAYPTGLLGHWLARRLRCPHVITTHGTYGLIWHQAGTDRRLYENVLRQASAVCPVSQGTASLLRQYFGHALRNVPVRPILNGNDFTTQVTREAAWQRPIPAVPALLSVGDIKPRKGQFTSLKAFALVKAQLSSAHYHIVGSFQPDQPYYRQMQNFIIEQDLADVNFAGVVSQDNLRRYYQEASVFVLTPEEDGLHFEGFGLVYLEAGAYGLPVVAARSGGVPDAVRDGETGLLALPGDVEGIAAALLRLLTDADLARQMGQANRLWAETLTWERTAQAQAQVYQDILAGCR